MSETTAQDGSLHLTREQAVLIACRLFAAYLLFWVIADITELPREILSFTHYQRESFEMGRSFVSGLAVSIFFVST